MTLGDGTSPRCRVYGGGIEIQWVAVGVATSGEMLEGVPVWRSKGCLSRPSPFYVGCSAIYFLLTTMLMTASGRVSSTPFSGEKMFPPPSCGRVVVEVATPVHTPCPYFLTFPMEEAAQSFVTLLFLKAPSLR